MLRHDYLTAVFMPPLLVTASLGNQLKSVLAKCFGNFLAIPHWKPLTHGRASSTILLPSLRFKGAGSNQSCIASLALAMASDSVSPALAQPGNSGKTADHRCVSEHCSTTSRNFIPRICHSFPNNSTQFHCGGGPVGNMKLLKLGEDVALVDALGAGDGA